MEHPTAKFLKLRCGDDIVSEVVEIEDDKGLTFILVNPLKLVTVPTTQSSMHLGLTPWVYPKVCDAQEFEISEKEVVTIAEVNDKMNEFYWTNVEELLKESSPNTRSDSAATEVEEYDEETLEELQELWSRRTYH